MIIILLFALYIASRLGYQVPLSLPHILPLAHSFTVNPSHNRCLDYQQTIDTLAHRIGTLESQMGVAAFNPELHLHSFAEGSRPRSFSRVGDGARNIPALTSPTYTPRRGILHRLTGDSEERERPAFVLHDIVGPYCWEIAGSEGHIGIRLSEPAHISMFSVAHRHLRALTPLSLGKTPKNQVLWGLYPNASSIPSGSTLRPASEFLLSLPPKDLDRRAQFIHLANGTYSPSLPNRTQFFLVPPTLFSALISPISVVVVEVLENWGSGTTSLCSIGIHDEA